MPIANLESRTGFCTWSVQPTNLDDLIAKANATGILNVQLAIDPLRESPADWHDVAGRFQSANIKILSAMFGTVGEDYSTIQRIHETGGVVPDETWPASWQNFQTMMPMVRDLGVKLVTFHAGFVPDDQTDLVFGKVTERLQQVADLAATMDISIALETGQEKAPTLKAAFDAIGRPNLGVNFDPANMILYGSGDPIDALRLLSPHVMQVHIKDATASANPGVDWGEEVVTGTGQVDWHAFFNALSDANYTGDLVIEREAGDQRVEEIRAALSYLQTL